jgi:hypothetical protein
MNWDDYFRAIEYWERSQELDESASSTCDAFPTAARNSTSLGSWKRETS